MHPIGLSVLAAPFYASGGYEAVVALIATMAACTGLLMWRFARHVTGSSGAATFAWIACAFSAPFVFNSFAIYPEIPAGLTVMIAYLLTLGVISLSLGIRRWGLCGIAIAALPWLSTKYVLMAGALTVVALGRIWRPASGEKPPEFGEKLSFSLALCLPPALSLAGWLAFFW